MNIFLILMMPLKEKNKLKDGAGLKKKLLLPILILIGIF